MGGNWSFCRTHPPPHSPQGAGIDSEPATLLEAATFIPVSDLPFAIVLPGSIWNQQRSGSRYLCPICRVSFENCIAEIDLEPAAPLEAATFVPVVDFPLNLYCRDPLGTSSAVGSRYLRPSHRFVIRNLYCGNRFGTISAVESRYIRHRYRFAIRNCIAGIDLEPTAPLEAATFVPSVDSPRKIVLRRSIWNQQRRWKPLPLSQLSISV